MKLVRAHVIIYGQVQGVFFRASTMDEAVRLGLKGWVMNRADGGVEAVFEGEEARVREMIAWCHRGPALARVTQVQVNYQPYVGEFDRFQIRYY